jgi:hypothetical protein
MSRIIFVYFRLIWQVAGNLSTIGKMLILPHPGETLDIPATEVDSETRKWYQFWR